MAGQEGVMGTAICDSVVSTMENGFWHHMTMLCCVGSSDHQSGIIFKSESDHFDWSVPKADPHCNILHSAVYKRVHC